MDFEIKNDRSKFKKHFVKTHQRNSLSQKEQNSSDVEELQQAC